MHDSPGDGESAWAIVESKSITDHQYGTLEQETLMRNSGDKEKNEYIRESVVTTKEGGSVQRTEYYDSDVHQDGSQTVWHEETTTITDEDGNIVSTTTERKTVEISASGEEKVVEDSRTVDGESTVKMDNPMNDNSAPPMNEKNDPLGVIRKHDNGLKGIKDVNPYIDPIVQGAIQDNSGYTNTSLDAASLSNGGTSTGSWNNPYGFGGYSGPSMDAISLSIGGTSTGTDWL